MDFMKTQDNSNRHPPNHAKIISHKVRDNSEPPRSNSLDIHQECRGVVKHLEDSIKVRGSSTTRSRVNNKPLSSHFEKLTNSKSFKNQLIDLKNQINL